MRLLISTILLLFGVGQLQAQGLQVEPDSLENEIERLESRINSVFVRSGSRKEVEKKVELRKHAGPFGPVIATVPSGTMVPVTGKDETYARVEYDGREGWVNSEIAFGEEVSPVTGDAKEEVQRLRERVDRKRCLLKIARTQNVSAPAKLIRAACRGEVRVGMTPKLVREAWGSPSEKNVTRTEYSRREQWVYGSLGDRRYVYIEGGEVTTIQQ